MESRDYKPFISVAMSSYNGEKYIADQIDSILGQEDVNINLLVRDDGSTDSTMEVLNYYSHRKDITLIKGDNVGLSKSFMSALLACPDSDYYAFADQDDVWFPRKIISTIKKIQVTEKPQLFFCNSYYTDENLNVCNEGYEENYHWPSKEMTFVSSVASGYLMIMNKKMVDLLRIVGTDIPITHDFWVGAVASFLGEIYYCSEKLVYHRRLKSSVSRLTPVKLFRNRMKALFIDMGVNVQCADLMLRNYKDMLKFEDIEFLKDVRNYREDLNCKIRLLRNPNLKYEKKYGSLTPKIKIILNRF